MLGVEPQEHRDRQDRTRRTAAERGLRALVSFSRSGGVHDRIADALWLTGLATPQPFVPDLPAHWRATGHVVVVVPVDGPVTAVVESEELRSSAVADEVVVSSDVVAAGAAAVARALSRREHARVGVLGADAVPFAWWAALAEVVRTACPDAALEAADDLGMALRRIKSPAEQALVRAAGRLGGRAMTTALDAAVPGTSEAEVALRESVLAGVHALRPGVPLTEVAQACEDALAGSAHARRHGVPAQLMGGFWGHGLGLAFEPPWVGPDSAEVVEPGSCLAIERRAAVAGLGGAQYEDDVLIGPDGAEVLTVTESARA